MSALQKNSHTIFFDSIWCLLPSFKYIEIQKNYQVSAKNFEESIKPVSLQRIFACEVTDWNSKLGLSCKIMLQLDDEKFVVTEGIILLFWVLFLGFFIKVELLFTHTFKPCPKILDGVGFYGESFRLYLFLRFEGVEAIFVNNHKPFLPFFEMF